MRTSVKAGLMWVIFSGGSLPHPWAEDLRAGPVRQADPAPRPPAAPAAPKDPQRERELIDKRVGQLNLMTHRSDVQGLVYLTNQLAKETRLEVRKALLYVLTQYQHQDALAVVTLAYGEEKNKNLRETILKNLGAVKDERSLPFLFRVAESRDAGSMKEEALEALMAFIPSDPPDDLFTQRVGLLLLHRLKETVGDYGGYGRGGRRRPLEALRKMRVAMLVPPLFEILRQRNPPAASIQRQYAAMILVNHAADPKIRSELLAEWKREKDDQVRAALMEGLVLSDDPEVYQEILSLLKISKEYGEVNGLMRLLREQVRHFYGKNFPEEMGGVVRELLTRGNLDSFAREGAFSVLEAMDPEVGNRELMAVIGETSRVNDLYHALKVLDKRRSPEVVEALIRRSALEKDHSICRVILDALITWPGDRITEYFASLANDPDPVKQAYAARAMDERGMGRPHGFTPRN